MNTATQIKTSSRQNFHTSLVGKFVREKTENSWNENAKLSHFGLHASVGEILGAWIKEDKVVVFVRDFAGATAEVYASLYLVTDS